MNRAKALLLVVITSISISGAANAQGPRPVEPSSIIVKAQYWGTTSTSENQNSPVAIGGLLYFVSQEQGKIYCNSGHHRSSPLLEIFDVATATELSSLDFTNVQEKILNVAQAESRKDIYVAFSTTTPPNEINTYAMPFLPGTCCDDNRDIEDLYRVGNEPGFANTQTWYQVIYKYRLRGSYKKNNKRFTNPEPIIAFETQSTVAHRGGGMIGLPDGRLVFATGDALPWTDGRDAPQDDSSHLGKLLLIDPITKTFNVAAKGIRNVQHIEYVAGSNNTVLALSDIGGVTAEEVNSVLVADLVDLSTVENFGWGRNSEDNKAREGTFYISPGIPGQDGQPPYESDSPMPEYGFIQPHAQYSRDVIDLKVAITGPVTSTKAFGSLTTMFSDLRSGKLFGTEGDLEAVDVTVFELNLIDDNNQPTSLEQLAGGRPDPRFFRSPSGHAFVLLEATGAYYRLNVR